MSDPLVVFGFMLRGKQDEWFKVGTAKNSGFVRVSVFVSIRVEGMRDGKVYWTNSICAGFFVRAFGLTLPDDLTGRVGKSHQLRVGCQRIQRRR